MENKKNKIGLIGGSGLEDPKILKGKKDRKVSTPYGQTSSMIQEGEVQGVTVAILSRHGRKHTIPPTQVNNLANIFALKKVGCTHILSTTAVGSLKDEIERGDLVILDQFIDFTRHRKVTYFDKFHPGEMKHTPMAEPFSRRLRKVLIENASDLQLKVHEKGTVVTIEGPRFSTKAESKMFQLWGGDVINMSIAPEVILANELNIPYGAIAMSTDYDCWKEDEEPVTWEAVLEIFKENVGKVTELLVKTIPLI